MENSWERPETNEEQKSELELSENEMLYRIRYLEETFRRSPKTFGTALSLREEQ
jgi:hypothetical protein